MRFSSFKTYQQLLSAIAICSIVLLNVLPQSLYANQHKEGTSKDTVFETHTNNQQGHLKLFFSETDVDSDSEIDFEAENDHTYSVLFSFSSALISNNSECLRSKHITTLYNKAGIPLFILHHSWRSQLC